VSSGAGSMIRFFGDELTIIAQGLYQVPLRLRRRCLRIPREIVDAIVADMEAPAFPSLRLGGVKPTPVFPFSLQSANALDRAISLLAD